MHCRQGSRPESTPILFHTKEKPYPPKISALYGDKFARSCLVLSVHKKLVVHLLRLNPRYCLTDQPPMLSRLFKHFSAVSIGDHRTVRQIDKVQDKKHWAQYTIYLRALQISESPGTQCLLAVGQGVFLQINM